MGHDRPQCNLKEAIKNYADGFVLPVGKDELEDYKKMAELGRSVWMDHSALSYVESQGDELPYGEVTSFPRAVQATDDEIVFLALITFESREKRDEINAKVMADACMTFREGF